MRCPFSKKICLLPKEIVAHELNNNETTTLHLCKLCGDKYISELSEADIVTKSLEVISTDGGVSHAEHILKETEKIEAPKAEKQVSIVYQIKKVEAKLQEAIDNEDYEAAAKLRDELNEIKIKKLDDDKQL